MGWKCYLDSWIGKIKDQSVQDVFDELVHKWVEKLFRAKDRLKEIVKCSYMNIIISFTRLMDSFVSNESGTIGYDV